MTTVKINPALIAYHEDHRHEVIFNIDGLLGKLDHISAVIKFGLAIADAQHSPLDREMLKLCLEHHDDGRVKQFKLLGKFWDTEVSHNVLGLDGLDNFLQQNKAEIDESVEILRNVILYHGRLNLLGDVSEESRAYVELVTAADDFENACSCVSYLVKEVKSDEKGYCQASPGKDQLSVSNYVFSHFEKGIKFDKLMCCHTYAEYVLFAATLAISCIKKYGDIAKTVFKQPGYGYDSILDGYNDVFTQTLSPKIAVDAYRILADMVG